MAKTSQSSGNSDPNENIEIPPISKRNAGAATGAVIGAVGGPIGALLGGVVGAVMGKAASSNKPVGPAVRRGAEKVSRAVVKTADDAKAVTETARSTARAIAGKKGKATKGRSAGKSKTSAKKASARKSKPASRGATKSKSKSSPARGAKSKSRGAKKKKGR